MYLAHIDNFLDHCERSWLHLLSLWNLFKSCITTILYSCLLIPGLDLLLLEPLHLVFVLSNRVLRVRVDHRRRQHTVFRGVRRSLNIVVFLQAAVRRFMKIGNLVSKHPTHLNISFGFGFYMKCRAILKKMGLINFTRNQLKIKWVNATSFYDRCVKHF